jgi:hypothetical protein
MSNRTVVGMAVSLGVMVASVGCSSTCRTPCETQCRPCESKCVPCGRPDADIEVLRAVNIPCTKELAIAYHVDTEKTCEELDLHVRVEHCGKVLFEKLVHLNPPYKTDFDGDRHSRGTIYGELSEVVCGNRERLVVIGHVLPHSAGGDLTASLDRERERVHNSDSTIFGPHVSRSWPVSEVHE